MTPSLNILLSCVLPLKPREICTLTQGDGEFNFAACQYDF